MGASEAPPRCAAPSQGSSADSPIDRPSEGNGDPGVNEDDLEGCARVTGRPSCVRVENAQIACQANADWIEASYDK